MLEGDILVDKINCGNVGGGGGLTRKRNNHNRHCLNYSWAVKLSGVRNSKEYTCL